MFRRFFMGATDEAESDLVEVRPVQAPHRSPVLAFAIPSDPSIDDRESRQPAKTTRLKTNVPPSGVSFYSRGHQVNLGIGALDSPLIYATSVSSHGRFDASLLDMTLPVAAVHDRVEQRLPYWPNYYDCTPSQRRRYLDWLLAGRKDPDIELGYVFIYFYGLERRVLVDREDYEAVAEEVIRLLHIYGGSNSFRRYGTSLLWMALYLANHHTTLSSELLGKAIKLTGDWSDSTLGLCLSVLKSMSLLLPSQLARVIAERDVRSSSSVIVGRHRTEFNRLFSLKYREVCGKGLRLDSAKRPKRVDYYPASGSLLRNLQSSSLPPLPPCLDVLGKPSQFKPFIEIWDKCIDSLRDFSRAKQKASGAITAEVFESMPPELRQGEHPEERAWSQAWEANVDAEHWPIVPVSVLAAIKKIGPRDRLTKTQCQQILRTADCIGFGVEPDARITGKNYRWDERVTLFFLEGEHIGDPTRYAAASVLLRLGASIAAADGQVDESELQYINEHLQGQFNLSQCEAKRLDRLQYLLLHSRTGDNAIGKAIATRLSVKQRQLVGEFLVGVAASDESITKEEVKALRKAYQSLELDESELDQLIKRHAETTQSQGSDEAAELQLDSQAISRIMAETLQVASLLRDAMADDDDDDRSDETEPEPQPSSAESNRELPAPESAFAQGLDIRYHAFLAVLMQAEEWAPTELRNIAKEQGIMLSGAIEVINDWSTERFGDWLIEEGESYLVHRHMMKSDDTE